MRFVGQRHILKQLQVILPTVFAEKTGTSILFRGPSGHGKTELATQCATFLSNGQYQECLGNNFQFDPSKWVHFVDEIHLMEHHEVLYPIIDEGKHVFFFCTNYDASLPEAMSNRCINFLFAPYSEDELRFLIDSRSKYYYPDAVKDHIIDLAGRNPRIIIKTFLSNMEMYWRVSGELPENLSDEKIIVRIDDLHDIVDGLDKNCRDYIRILRELGGRAASKLLASSLRLDENTVKYSIEPILLYKNMIKISSRGRELCVA